MIEPRLQALLAAAVQATSLAASAMTDEWGLDGEDATLNRLTEGKAAHTKLLAALAAFDYVPCDACGVPAARSEMTPRRLTDGAIVPTCKGCLEMIALLNEAAR